MKLLAAFTSALGQAVESFWISFMPSTGTSRYDIASRLVCTFFILRTFRDIYNSLVCYGLARSVTKGYDLIKSFFYSKQQPALRIFKQNDETMVAISNKMVQKFARHENVSKPNVTLPDEGWSFEEIEVELEKLQGLDHTRWEDGRVSGAVYHGGQELLEMQTKAFGKFSISNPIHPDVFPGVRKMEAEIVAMVCENLAQLVLLLT